MRIGLLTDLHLDDAGKEASWHNPYDFDGALDRVAGALDHFAAERVDVVAVCGDVAHHGAHALPARLDALLAAVPVPVVAVTGNHDGGPAALSAALPSSRAGLPAGESLAGLRLAGVHAGAEGADASALVDPPAIERWDAEPVVLLSHFPLVSHAERLGARGLRYPGDVHEHRAHAAVLERRATPTVVLSGHIHARDAQCGERILQLTQAALIEAPYECAVLDVEADDGEVAVRRRARLLAGPPPPGPLPVISPAEERFRWTAAGGWVAGDG